MERRTALAVAGTAIATITFGAAAAAANLGLLSATTGSDSEPPVAVPVAPVAPAVPPPTVAPNVQILYEDVPVPTAPPAGAPAPAPVVAAVAEPAFAPAT